VTPVLFAYVGVERQLGEWHDGHCGLIEKSLFFPVSMKSHKKTIMVSTTNIQISNGQQNRTTNGW
jgi:hypothetical protein